MPIDGDEGALYRLDSEEPRQDVSSQHPELAEEMKRLTRGLYESARYITNNNPRLEDEGKVIAKTE
jgi:hypothetical protein